MCGRPQQPKNTPTEQTRQLSHQYSRDALEAISLVTLLSQLILLLNSSSHRQLNNFSSQYQPSLKDSDFLNATTPSLMPLAAFTSPPGRLRLRSPEFSDIPNILARVRQPKCVEYIPHLRVADHT